VLLCRAESLALLREQEFDVLVIGGGITGAGVAFDAAARGLRVALVEGRDFVGGTSRWSTKLVHGGIRYLPQFDIGLVREALIERGRLLANARFWSSRCHFFCLCTASIAGRSESGGCRNSLPYSPS
jgi:glycerol-3-phosphate dehydrogenase